MEAARQIGRRAQLVFVTAYEQYAVQAFEQGALDYLVKPFEDARLEDTVARLRERIADRAPAAASPVSSSQLEAAIEQLADVLRRPSVAMPSGGEGYLQWLRASVGQTLKLIPVDQVDFLRSDEKYTLVVWAEGEALIRMSIRELMEQLDPKYFAQVHRSVVVNLRSVSHLTRGPNETADIHLRGRSEVLPVSRSYLHLFRQM